MRRLKESSWYRMMLPYKKWFWGISLFLAVVFLFEIWLNWSVRSLLRQNLMEGAGPKFRINYKISWISIGDFIEGRIRRVWLKAEDCGINNLRYQLLQVDCDGFTFDRAILFGEKKLRIVRIDATKINATITAKALQEYLKIKYPDLNIEVELKPEHFQLNGAAPLIGKVVSISLIGDLQAISWKQLRFYPKSLIVSGRKVSKQLLEYLGNQIPLEFSLMADWPLKITNFSLKQDFLTVSFQELKE